MAYLNKALIEPSRNATFSAGRLPTEPQESLKRAFLQPEKSLLGRCFFGWTNSKRTPYLAVAVPQLQESLNTAVRKL
jgi:hypothetical protein